ncbi:hypothetical protein GJAV_G00107920 [Gymnothorax javanicus]|nr:hypothetical protein GJAV_G00107920 [Gymnothorax javanicus]
MADDTHPTAGPEGAPDGWGLRTANNITPANSTVMFEPMYSPLMDKILNIVIVIILFATMISLGCTMEIAKIRAYLMRPKGVAIAAFSQYGFMPLAAFLLGKALRLDVLESLCILICGCCPGGTLSNIMTLAVQGDMNLSIVMTSCSILLALGMMPLLLYLYSHGIPNIESMVPYTGIILALFMTLVPCAIGITINHRAPRYSPYIMKVGMVILLISSTGFAIFASVTTKHNALRVLSPRLLITSALMPVLGFLFGYIMSTIFRLNGKCRRTIGVETGCQNTQICFTILKVAFPLEVIGPLFLFPFVFLLFQTTEAAILAIFIRCYKRFKARPKEKQEHQAVELKPEEDKALNPSQSQNV